MTPKSDKRKPINDKKCQSETYPHQHRVKIGSSKVLSSFVEDGDIAVRLTVV